MGEQVAAGYSKKEPKVDKPISTAWTGDSQREIHRAGDGALVFTSDQRQDGNRTLCAKHRESGF